MRRSNDGSERPPVVTTRPAACVKGVGLVIGAGAVLVLSAGAPAVRAAKDEKPAVTAEAAAAAHENMVGVWKLNPELSEDPRAKMQAEGGGRGGPGGFGGGPAAGGGGGGCGGGPPAAVAAAAARAAAVATAATAGTACRPAVARPARAASRGRSRSSPS